MPGVVAGLYLQDEYQGAFAREYVMKSVCCVWGTEIDIEGEGTGGQCAMGIEVEAGGDQFAL